MNDETGTPSLTISDLFPVESRLLLTGGGKEFIERIGVEAARKAVLQVMMGENVRTQTEPLTRRRIAQVTGAMIALFVNGATQLDGFSDGLSGLAVEQIAKSKKNDNASLWPAQWLIGLTGKSVQNVLRNSPDFQIYLSDFESAVSEAADKLRSELGNIKMTLGFIEDATGRTVALDWKSITRLTTAIGSATLTIRGSDKSIYGKLFERLILGTMLTLLGFQRVNPATNTKTQGVFWLSDSSDNRESDATLLLRPGRLARFDIGFIGPGNSEISKDKLSRYAREMERDGSIHDSTTFIIVDRLPRTGKTEQAARQIGAEIVQMSMQYWPRDLARKLNERLDFVHEMQEMPDHEIGAYLARQIASIPIQDFLIGVTPADLETDSELPDADEEVENAVAHGDTV